jgi:hypothetical protein
MTTVTFDTHAAIKYLMKKGIKQEQAEAFVKITREAHDLNQNELVTKDYLDAKLEAQDMKLEAKLSRTKYEVVAWLIACTIAIIAILKH